MFKHFGSTSTFGAKNVNPIREKDAIFGSSVAVTEIWEVSMSFVRVIVGGASCDSSPSPF